VPSGRGECECYRITTGRVWGAPYAFCVVDLNGVEGAVEVMADSLYEAVAHGFRAFGSADWAGEMGRGAAHDFSRREATQVEHKVRIKDLRHTGISRPIPRKDDPENKVAPTSRRVAKKNRLTFDQPDESNLLSLCLPFSSNTI
jgi:hypothetical protein